MKIYTTSSIALTSDIALDTVVSEACDAVGASFERFFVMAGISSLQKMMGEDASREWKCSLNSFVTNDTYPLY